MQQHFSFESSEKQQLELPDSQITYYPGFFDTKTSDLYFDRLRKETDWRQDDIRVFGKVYAQPRLTALYGEQGKPYTYSGITMTPLPFTPLLRSIKEQVEQLSKATFSTVLLNLYRDGQDSNGWHSDDEKELGHNPVIASVSFGQIRRFRLKHKQHRELKYHLDLTHGSLLLMSGPTQHHWKHQIPKTTRKVEPRINLTFRLIRTG